MTSIAATTRIASASPLWGARAQRDRALKLLLGGFVVTNAVAAVCAAICGLLAGGRGLASSLMAAAIVIACFTLQQGVQVVVANADPMTVLLAALASYLVPFVGLGVGLWYALPYADSGVIDKPSLVATLLACVAAWTTAVIVVFQRLRFPVYDTEYTPPADPGSIG